MKKLSLLITATLGLALGASAQNVNLDLVDVLFPKSNTNYNAVNQGDTVVMAWVFQNNGTEAVQASDTVYINTNGWFMDQSGYSLTYKRGGFTTAVGALDTFMAYYVDGVSTWNNGAIKAKTPNGQTIDTAIHYIYGRRNGVDFPSDSLEYSGTNIVGVAGSNINASLNFSFAPGTNSIKNLAQTTLNVYPNPASSSINFTHDFAKATTASVKVLDLMGRVVMTEQYDVNAGAKNFNLDVTGLANGSYFVELTTAEERGVTKFTIAK